MRKIFAFVVLTGLLGSQNLQAQEISRVATASGQFLKLGIGARAAALGEAQVALPGDVIALYWNPAGIAAITRTSLTVSRINLFADISHHFVGLVYPVGRGSALGLGIAFLNSGKIEVTTLDHPNGTGLFYDVDDLSIGLTYGRSITDRLMGGVTVKLVQEGIYRETARTVAVDLGTVLDTGLLGIRLGMSLTNFGGDMKLGGPDLSMEVERWTGGARKVKIRLETDKWPLPLTFRMGIASDLIGLKGQLATSENHRLTFAFDTNDSNDALLRSNVGLEYEWNKLLALRVGYHGFVLAKDEHGTYETSDLTLGGGLRYDLGWAAIQADYSLSDYGMLGNVHQFTFGLGF